MSCDGVYLTIAHAILQKYSYLWFRAIISHYKSCVFPNGKRRCILAQKKMTSTHVHSLYTQNSPLSISFSGALVKTFNISAERPKFYSSTVRSIFYIGRPIRKPISPRGQVEGFSLVHFDPF